MGRRPVAEALRAFIAQQEPLVYFVYGLVYFLMGVAVLLQSRGCSALKSARHHYLLGLFGLVHGLADWGPLFIPMQAGIYGPRSTSGMWYVYLGLLVVSFIFLYYFGVNILVAFYPRHRWLRLAPAAAVFLWVVLFWFYGGQAHSPQEWRYYGSTWARYLLALPGSALTAAGLSAQAREVRQMGFPGVAGHLARAALLFVCYAFFAGAAVPAQAFFPANWMNQDSFAIWTGLPVQVFRALTGITLAGAVIRYLEVFSLEIRLRLEAAERNQAALQERERIARDIHDGVLQSLYSLRLRVEHCLYLLRDHPAHPVGEHLRYCMEELTGTIGEIRCFIGGAGAVVASPGLSRRLEQLLDDFQASTGIKVEFFCQEDEGRRLSPAQEEHLVYLIREALSNVARHAGASRVELKITFRDDGLTVALKDDGCGFSIPEQRDKGARGLRNMAVRAEALGGELRLQSRPGAGTLVEVEIPWAGRQAAAGSAGRK
ncbi:MAG: sensor histidine kinase [Clostridia bacterium]|nr:MAG: sensor histidine kinase [Clostridia bacterium]